MPIVSQFRVSLCTLTSRRELLPLLLKRILEQAYPRHLMEWIVVDVDDKKPLVPPLSDNQLQGLALRYEYLGGEQTREQKRRISLEMCSGDIIIIYDDRYTYSPLRVSHSVKVLASAEFSLAGCPQVVAVSQDKSQALVVAVKQPLFCFLPTAAFINPKMFPKEDRWRIVDASGVELIGMPPAEYSQLNPLDVGIAGGPSQNNDNYMNTLLNSSHLMNQSVSISQSPEFMKQILSLLELLPDATISDSPELPRTQSLDKNKTHPWLTLGYNKGYCVTLESKKDRQQYLRSHLPSLGIEPILFKATTPETLPKILSDRPIFNRPTQLACLVSHLRLMRELANQTSQAESYLIIEDDVILRPHFDAERFASLFPPDWEIIQLSTSNLQALERNLFFSKHGVSFVRWNHDFWGTYAYLIRHHTAKKLSTQYLTTEGDLTCVGLNRPGFIVADFILYFDVRTYTSCNPMASYNCEYRSDIGYSDSSAAAQAKASRLILSHWASECEPPE